MNTNYKSHITGRVTVKDTRTGEIMMQANTTCDGITQVLAGLVTDGLGKINKIYGQWGTTANYAEGGGPYIVPNSTDTLIDLNGAIYYTTDAEVSILRKYLSTEPDQVLYTDNVATFEALLTMRDGDLYIGAGLVASGTLVAHVAFTKAVLKRATHDLLISWDLTFRNVI